MSNPPALRGLIEQLYATDFPAAQSIWVEAFLPLLIDLRRVFGNDLDKVIILSVIGQQMLRDPAMPALSHDDARTGSLPVWPWRTTNIDALARTTGIPRESVRRKVAELIADNLVVRADSGGLTIQAGASARLASSTLVTIAMLDTVFEKFLTLLRTRGELDFTQTTPPKSTA